MKTCTQGVTFRYFPRRLTGASQLRTFSVVYGDLSTGPRALRQLSRAARRAVFMAYLSGFLRAPTPVYFGAFSLARSVRRVPAPV